MFYAYLFDLFITDILINDEREEVQCTLCAEARSQPGRWISPKSLKAHLRSPSHHENLELKKHSLSQVHDSGTHQSAVEQFIGLDELPYALSGPSSLPVHAPTNPESPSEDFFMECDYADAQFSFGQCAGTSLLQERLNRQLEELETWDSETLAEVLGVPHDSDSEDTQTQVPEDAAAKDSDIVNNLLRGFGETIC